MEYGGEDPDDRSDSKSGSEVGSESGSDGGSDKRSDKSNDSNRRRKKRDIADYIGDKLHPLKLSDTGRWDMNWYEEEEVCYVMLFLSVSSTLPEDHILHRSLLVLPNDKLLIPRSTSNYPLQ